MNFPSSTPGGSSGLGTQSGSSGSLGHGPVARGMMAAARVAQGRWREVSLGHRLKMVRRFRGLVAEHAEALAGASSSARSRPLAEAMTAEVIPLAEACRFLEREAGSILAGRRIGSRGGPLWLSGVTSRVTRDPLGVVLIVGPGNYPLLLPGVQVLQALVAGNGVLLKPGVGGSRAAEVLVQLLGRAGFDPALVHLLPESVEAAEAALDAAPDKVIFTGSAVTGRRILTRLAARGVPSVMELSGCDGVIIRPDAALDLAVRALVFGLRLNDGATCMGPKRVFVHRAVATELEGRLASALARPSGGDSSEVALRGAVASRVRPVVEAALASGAHLLSGRLEADGSLTGPLVLAGVRAGSRVLQEDVFAPVTALMTVADDDEAVARLNDCPYALGASVFSRNVAVAGELARRLDVGVVTINDLIVPTADARLPFGGRRDSGFGVTRGPEGLLELTVPKVVTWSRGTFRPAYDAPGTGDEVLFGAYARLAHAGGWRARWKAMISLCRAAMGRRRRSGAGN